METREAREQNVEAREAREQVEAREAREQKVETRKAREQEVARLPRKHEVEAREARVQEVEARVSFKNKEHLAHLEWNEDCRHQRILDRLWLSPVSV